MQVMKFEDNFYDVLENTDRVLVLYGIGKAAKKVYSYLPAVSYVIDQKADGVMTFHDILVRQPEELKKINKPLAILICVQDVEISNEIKSRIQKMDINAIVFEYCNNSGFDIYHPVKYVSTRKQIKYVRLVCHSSGWILDKFADRMKEQLQLRGIRAEISDSVDSEADINHHIPFHPYEPIKDYADTLMITHVDSLDKLNLLKHQLRTARMGICMSRETMNTLVNWGIPREKLCYINPAQDGAIKPKKYTLGITHKTYMDGRKRVEALLDICNVIDPSYFKFKIMGAGWENIVKEMQAGGFEVEYYPEFDYEVYVNLIPSLDYYLFWGFDEGSMGYLDALAAGVETIVTPQGYHLDVKEGITYPCRTVDDFTDVLLELQNKRKKRTELVEKWTWSNYVDKHLEVWSYILGNDNEIYHNKHFYEDGIFSVLVTNV